MNLLLSSYSFGAGRGSEAGVGWNVARGMALRGHQVTVITTREFSACNRETIENEKLPIKLIEEDCGISFYPSSQSYRSWQRRIDRIIRRELETGHYHLIHHVTFNQYRDIHDVFAADIPYLIGPVGGAELVPRPLLRYGDLPLCMKLKEMLRYCGADVLPLRHRCRRHKQHGLILASNHPTAERLKNLSTHIEICPAIAIHSHEIIETPPPRNTEDSFILFDGGLARPQKGTWLAIRALARLWKMNCRLPLRMVGIAAQDAEKIRHYANTLQLPTEALILESQVTRAEMLRYMQRATIMLSTVYRDSGSMAQLEALAQGCRIVSLDIPSQKWLPSHFSHKVAVQPTTEAMEQALAAALQQEALAQPHTDEWHAERNTWLLQHMTWEARLNTLETHYRQLLA